MFVWSFKLSKREIIIFSVGAAAFIIFALLLLSPSRTKTTSAEATGISTTADSADARRGFLSQFGWQTDSDPKEVREVVIPFDFGEAYEQYNEIQKKQGFDLTQYRGERVKKWTYRVKNYPGASGDVLANLLIKDGKVIGGDISEAQDGGFTHGFDPTQSAQVTAQNQTGGDIDRSVPASIPADSDVPPEPDDL